MGKVLKFGIESDSPRIILISNLNKYKTEFEREISFYINSYNDFHFLISQYVAIEGEIKKWKREKLIANKNDEKKRIGLFIDNLLIEKNRVVEVLTSTINFYKVKFSQDDFIIKKIIALNFDNVNIDTIIIADLKEYMFIFNKSISNLSTLEDFIKEDNIKNYDLYNDLDISLKATHNNLLLTYKWSMDSIEKILSHLKK